MKKGSRKKRILLSVCGLFVLCAAVLAVILFRSPSIRYVPKGYVSREEHLSTSGFQDHTDLCLYRYLSSDGIRESADYREMTEADAELVRGYFSDFGRWLDSEEYRSECADAEGRISAGDYFRLDTREGETIGDTVYGEYDSYSVWFFDTETLTLCYIHVNI